MPHTSTAARLARVRRDKFGRALEPPRSSGTTYTGDANAGPIGLTVELYLDGMGWVDITPYVYYRDMVRISRGKSDETGTVQPQGCFLTLNNRDGRFSPRNPSGPWYGVIGRNTPLRVSRMQNGVRRYRFVGEVPSWPTTSDISNADVYVHITAYGALRRLSQSPTASGSSVYRWLAYSEQGVGATAFNFGSAVNINAIAYWPLEDGSSATSAASGLTGGSPLNISGSPNLASNSDFQCSMALPVLNGASLTGVIPPYTPSPVASTFLLNELVFLLKVPTAGETDNTVIAQLYTSGNVYRLDVVYRTSSSGTVTLNCYNGATTLLGSATAVLGFALNGARVAVQMGVETSSGDALAFVDFYNLDTGVQTVLSASVRVTGGNVGVGQQVVINAGGLKSTVLGHVLYTNGDVNGQGFLLSTFSNVFSAWLGENPATRFVRLSGEQGVNSNVVDLGTSGNAVTMGYQLSETFPTLVQQIADADAGLLFEARDQLSLTYRMRTSLYNQGTSYSPMSRQLVLDYEVNSLSEQLQPQDDDFYTRNDVTAQRINGSSSRLLLNSGALSVQPPPSGVGTYQVTYSLSLGSDTLVTDGAGWRLHLSTVDEPRYPRVSVNLRHAAFQSNLNRLNAALNVDIGDVIEIDNPPSWLPPDSIRQIIQGYSETMGTFEHDIVFNCSPESPYRVMVAEDTVLGRADTDGSTLAGTLSNSLNPNQFFTGGSLSTWVGFRCSISSVGSSGSSNAMPSGGPTGYGVLIAPDGSLTSCAAEQNGGGALFPVIPGNTYFASALVYSPLGWAAVTVGFDWLDANNAFLSTSVSNTAVAANTWTAITQSHAAPANSANAYVRVGLGTTPGVSDLLYATCVVVWQGAVSVATTTNGLPLWTTTGSDFPFDIVVGGERMTVTAVSGSTSPQSFTVARGVNNVAKGQSTGTDVRLWQPAILSL